MRLQDRLGLIYAVLVTLIVAMGVWWVVFLSQEGDAQERFRLQQLATDRLHAAYLVQTVPAFHENPESLLKEHFPHLIFAETPRGRAVAIDPVAEKEIRDKARSRRRMIASEGIFFLLLLAGGTTVLIVAMRREREFKRARELFLAGATHEFRTPLASLHLYTETLARPDLKESDRSHILDVMMGDLLRLESMVDHVLALSRGESIVSRRDRFDAGAAAATVLSEMGAFLQREGAVIESDLPDGLMIVGDGEAFAVALRNLVRNAVLYSPPPARVTVRLDRRDDKLRLAVSDRGPGIPRRDRKRIFSSFVRLESGDGSLRAAPSGSGLGLYLVRRNAELLGGNVEVESEEGRGSTFTIILPAAAGEKP